MTFWGIIFIEKSSLIKPFIEDGFSSIKIIFKGIKKDTTEDIDTILVKNPKNHIFLLFINTLFIYEKISSKKPIKASIPL